MNNHLEVGIERHRLSPGDGSGDRNYHPSE